MYERRGHLKRPIAGVTLRRAHVPQQGGLRRRAGARAARGAARAAGELEALRLAPHPLLRRSIFLSSGGCRSRTALLAAENSNAVLGSASKIHYIRSSVDTNRVTSFAFLSFALEDLAAAKGEGGQPCQGEYPVVVDLDKVPRRTCAQHDRVHERLGTSCTKTKYR